MIDSKDLMLTEDMTLDQIEDLPSFECWPTGIYKVVLNDGITSDQVGEEKKPAFIANLTLQEIKAIGDDTISDDDKPKVNDEMRLMFMRGNAFGMNSYKVLATPISKALGVSTVGEINEGSKGIELIVVINKAKGKKPRDDGSFSYFPRLLEAMLPS